MRRRWSGGRTLTLAAIAMQMFWIGAPKAGSEACGPECPDSVDAGPTLSADELDATRTGVGPSSNLASESGGAGLGAGIGTYGASLGSAADNAPSEPAHREVNIDLGSTWDFTQQRWEPNFP